MEDKEDDKKQSSDGRSSGSEANLDGAINSLMTFARKAKASGTQSPLESKNKTFSTCIEE